MRILPIRKTYNSCDELPLSNFINIVCSNDLKYLYAEPARFIHKQADLPSIWEGIFNQYNELSNSTNAMHVISLIRDISILQNRIKIVNDCVKLLLDVEDIAEFEPTINILKSFGCTFEFNNDNKVEMLKKSISVCKRFIIQLNEAEKEYRELNKSEEKKVTKQDFYDTIAHLSKFLGFPINLEKTTVSMYISYINQLKQANSLENGK